MALRLPEHWLWDRLLRHRGRWVFLAWRLHDERGTFVGELSDPMALTVGRDGSLRVGARDGLA